MSSNLGLYTVRRRLFATAVVARRHVSTTTHCRSSSAAARVVNAAALVGQRVPSRQWRRDFYRSAILLEEEMSEKEKKKALKAKAKAAAAAAEEKEEEAAAERKKALQEKLAAKKAAEAAPAGGGEAATESSSAEAPKEETATPAAEESPPPSEATPEAPAKEETAEQPKSPAEATATTQAPKYSTPELAEDAAKHKAGLEDPDRPFFQNPLHHNNPEMNKMFPEDFQSEEEMEAATIPVPPMDLGDGIAAPEYLHALADEVVHLNMLEMNELVNKIADHYGFHEGILSPDEDGSEDAEDDDADEAAAPQEEVKTSFDIKLVEFDAKAKIKVIKEVRALAGLGLKEAKELVEGAPKVIHKGVKKEEADEIKAKLEELGATIEIV